MHIPVWSTPLGNVDLLQPLISIPLVGTFTLEHGARFIVLPIYIMVAANLVNTQYPDPNPGLRGPLAPTLHSINKG